jgi:anti-anti-sigma factor
MSESPQSSDDEIIDVEARQDRAGTTIVLVGELDMSGTEVFWAHVAEALASAPRPITVDASRLTFVDSAGLMALVRAREAAIEAGVAFRVRDPSPALRRIAELGGLEDLLPPD